MRYKEENKKGMYRPSSELFEDDSTKTMFSMAFCTWKVLEKFKKLGVVMIDDDEYVVNATRTPPT